MKIAAIFSAIVFAPVLVAFLLPAMFIMPTGVSFTLIALFDPSMTFFSAISYDLWIIGPVLAAISLFGVGIGLYYLHLQSRVPLAAWLVTWLVLAVALFFAVWIGVIIVTSIGASETPPHIFLRITALISAGLTLLAQVLVIPWLICVSKILPGLKKTINSNKGHKSIENE